MIRFLLTLCSLLSLATVGLSQENRSFSGEDNNIANPQWGAAHTPLLRVSTVNYADQVQEINDSDLPLPRKVSNDLFAQNTQFPNTNNLSDFVWLFGQFLDHDISQVASDPSQSSLLEIPIDEAYFDANAQISLLRNKEIPTTGQNGIPRAYANEVSSFIDASTIYGSDIERANWLRAFQGGRLKVSKTPGISSVEGDLLPWNTINNEYGGSSIDFSAPKMEDETSTSGQQSKLFVSGDTRANENPLLIAMHTLFVREHNRLCLELRESYPNWNDEQLYQRARKLVSAYIQSITYNEWLPAMGVFLPEYTGYNNGLEPAVYNVFSAAAFRIGHTMVDGDIIRMDNEGNEIQEGVQTLANTFFRPQTILTGGGVDAYFKGMGTQVMQEMDCKMIDDLRNFSFSDDGTSGLDIVSKNIFRSRDRGLSDYNTLRQDFGLAPLTEFDQLTNDPEDARILSELYTDINKIDAWVGMLSEKHIDSDANFGELVMHVLKEQFRILRDGDRFYYENDGSFSQAQKLQIQNTSLHDIIMRNTNISLMQSNVFEAMPHSDIPLIELDQISLNTVVYPNPVVDLATAKIYSDIAQTMDYKLVDFYGRVVFGGQLDLEEGAENYLFLNFDASYASGIYNLILETSSGFNSVKIAK